MGQRKLTDEQVEAVRAWHRARKALGTQETKARELGVTRQTIAHICTVEDYRPPRGTMRPRARA